MHRFKSGYTDGARMLASRSVIALRQSRVTPNQLTALGFSLNIVAAVLLFEELYVVAGITFLVGSIIDILDGALARLRGQATQFGAFIDSTTDRVVRGIRARSRGARARASGNHLGSRCDLRRAHGRELPRLVHSSSRRGPGPRRQGRADGSRRARRAAGGRHRSSHRSERCPGASRSSRPSQHLRSGSASHRCTGSSLPPRRRKEPPHEPERRGQSQRPPHARRQGSRRHRRSRATAPARSSRASSTTATRPDDFVPGLMHVDLGGYHVRDVEFVAAFDIDQEKVGKDLRRRSGRARTTR